MHSEPADWSLRALPDASGRERRAVTRSLRALLRPYLPVLALTILWYPVLGLFARQLEPTPSMGTVGLLFGVPIVALVFWVPRLSSERRRIVLELDATTLQIDRVRFDRARLLEVVLLPHTRFVARHRVLVTFTEGDFVNLVEVARERSIEAARGIGAELARWLAIPLEAATAAPPTAIVRPRPH